MQKNHSPSGPAMTNGDVYGVRFRLMNNLFVYISIIIFYINIFWCFLKTSTYSQWMYLIVGDIFIDSELL